jgi:hypothetical protein
MDWNRMFIKLDKQNGGWRKYPEDWRVAILKTHMNFESLGIEGQEIWIEKILPKPRIHPTSNTELKQIKIRRHIVEYDEWNE